MEDEDVIRRKSSIPAADNPTAISNCGNPGGINIENARTVATDTSPQPDNWIILAQFISGLCEPTGSISVFATRGDDGDAIRRITAEIVVVRVTTTAIGRFWNT
jgi:hypothetical protein